MYLKLSTRKAVSCIYYYVKIPVLSIIIPTLFAVCEVLYAWLDINLYSVCRITPCVHPSNLLCIDCSLEPVLPFGGGGSSLFPGKIFTKLLHGRKYSSHWRENGSQKLLVRGKLVRTPAVVYDISFALILTIIDVIYPYP